MARKIKIRSVNRKMSYSVSGTCEKCGVKYSIDRTVDVGMATSYKSFSDEHLINSSKFKAESTYWDVLQNIFLEPIRLKVYVRCSSCGHIQAWMMLSKEKRKLFDRIFCKESKEKGFIPTAPVFSITDNFDISIHDYPPEVPFGMKAMEKACLMSCVKNSVPLHYVKYLGAKVYSDSNYTVSGTEFNTVRSEIDYREAKAKRRELNRNLLFAFCIRMNGDNWKELARIVEDYHYGHVDEKDIMRLILPENNGGLSDHDIADREKLEKYLNVNRKKSL